MKFNIVEKMENECCINYSDKQKEQHCRDTLLIILLSEYRFTDEEISNFKLKDFVDHKGLLKKQIMVRDKPVFLTNPRFIKSFNKYYEWRKRNRTAYPDYPLIKSQKSVSQNGGKKYWGMNPQALQTRICDIGKKYGLENKTGSYLRDRFIDNLKLNFKEVG